MSAQPVQKKSKMGSNQVATPTNPESDLGKMEEDAQQHNHIHQHQSQPMKQKIRVNPVQTTIHDLQTDQLPAVGRGTR